MSQDSSEQQNDHHRKYNFRMLIIFPAWVFLCFMFSQYLVVGLLSVMSLLNISLKAVDPIVANTAIAGFVYSLTLVLVLFVPKLIKAESTSKEEVGLIGLPTWKDIVLAPAGLIVYFILSSILILIASKIIPGFDATQVQNTGFNNARQSNELLFAFITLVIVAPIAEEILFRGYLFSKLKKYLPLWLAILATSVFFGTIHFAWNVGVDTFALSIVLCILRETTGTIWASILLHMMKNGIAFYVLFVASGLLK
jgi:membrane protease YdiL (CAAX protease family)